MELAKLQKVSQIQILELIEYENMLKNNSKCSNNSSVNGSFGGSVSLGSASSMQNLNTNSGSLGGSVSYNWHVGSGLSSESILIHQLINKYPIINIYAHHKHIDSAIIAKLILNDNFLKSLYPI